MDSKRDRSNRQMENGLFRFLPSRNVGVGEDADERVTRKNGAPVTIEPKFTKEGKACETHDNGDSSTTAVIDCTLVPDATSKNKAINKGKASI